MTTQILWRDACAMSKSLHDILPALKDGVSVRSEKFGGGC